MQGIYGFEGIFWQIRKILRYEKPYFLWFSIIYYWNHKFSTKKYYGNIWLFSNEFNIEYVYIFNPYLN